MQFSRFRTFWLKVVKTRKINQIVIWELLNHFNGLKFGTPACVNNLNLCAEFQPFSPSPTKNSQITNFPSLEIVVTISSNFLLVN